MKKWKSMTVLLLFSLIILVIGGTFAYYKLTIRKIDLTYKGVIVNTKTWKLEEHATIRLKGEQKRNLFKSPESATFEGTIFINGKEYEECSNYLSSFEAGYPREVKSGELVQVDYKTQEGSVDFKHLGMLRTSNFSYDRLALTFEEEKESGRINETSRVLIAPAKDREEAKKLYQEYFEWNNSSSK